MKFKLSLSSFFVILFMLISGVCVYANPIENLDIISEDLKNADESAFVTNGDFAYTISRILGSGELENESDYINFANSHLCSLAKLLFGNSNCIGKLSSKSVYLSNTLVSNG